MLHAPCFQMELLVMRGGVMRVLTVVLALPNDASQGERDTAEWYIGTLKRIEENKKGPMAC